MLLFFSGHATTIYSAWMIVTFDRFADKNTSPDNFRLTLYVFQVKHLSNRNEEKNDRPIGTSGEVAGRGLCWGKGLFYYLANMLHDTRTWARNGLQVSKLTIFITSLSVIIMSRNYKIRDQRAICFVTFTVIQFWQQHTHSIELITNAMTDQRLNNE